MQGVNTVQESVDFACWVDISRLTSLFSDRKNRNTDFGKKTRLTGDEGRVCCTRLAASARNGFQTQYTSKLPSKIVNHYLGTNHTDCVINIKSFFPIKSY